MAVDEIRVSNKGVEEVLLAVVGGLGGSLASRLGRTSRVENELKNHSTDLELL
jgi:hypothetical protein